MSWANLDDRLHGHPKVRRLQRIPFAGAEAFGIWTWCLSWARAYSPLEGRLSVQDVACDWNADPEHMAEVFETLRTVGLVDLLMDSPIVNPDAYVIHDWADWQLSAQQRGGLHASAAAGRNPLTGRFGAGDQPAPAGDQPGSAGGPAGESRFTGSTPAGTELVEDGSPAGRTSPRLSSPRLSEPVRTVEEIRDLERATGYRSGSHPVPKPGGKKR